MKNIRLTLEYDGTAYSGWQVQPNAPTVQQALQEALAQLTGQTPAVIGAGRTDAGVHALGQTAHFFTDSRIPPARFAAALNSRLPADIRVRESAEVDGAFHARYSATGKHYRYTLHNAPQPCALLRQYSVHVAQRLDIDAMRTGAQTFVGTHDMRTFCAAGGSSRTFVRTIWRFDVTCAPPYVLLDVQGNGFLYNQVRIMAGTLLQCGLGKLPAAALPGILRAGERSLAGPTAPPRGLCLISVFYGDTPPHAGLPGADMLY